MNAPIGDDLLDLVREAAVGHEVFGELGRASDDDVWFLGRPEGEDRLQALRLQRRPGEESGPAYSLEIAEELDAGVAVDQGACRSCGAELRTFAAFCGRCGASQAGGDGGPGSPEELRTLLTAVRSAAAEHYDVLGQMPRAGAGFVYFALEKETARLVRLRLQDTGDGMEVKETKAMMPLPGALTASYTTAAPPPKIRRRPASPPAEKTEPASSEPAPARPRTAADRRLIYAVIVLSAVVVVQAVLFLRR